MSAAATSSLIMTDWRRASFFWRTSTKTCGKLNHFDYMYHLFVWGIIEWKNMIVIPASPIVYMLKKKHFSISEVPCELNCLPLARHVQTRVTVRVSISAGVDQDQDWIDRKSTTTTTTTTTAIMKCERVIALWLVLSFDNAVCLFFSFSEKLTRVPLSWTNVERCSRMGKDNLVSHVVYILAAKLGLVRGGFWDFHHGRVPDLKRIRVQRNGDGQVALMNTL